MSKEEVKHAVISLILGVITMTVTSLVLGFLDIFKSWIGELAGGATTTLAYLRMKNLV